MSERSPFKELEPTKELHLRLWLYAAVMQLVSYLYQLGGGEALGRFSFMKGYLFEVEQYLPDAHLGEIGESWADALAEWELDMPETATTWPMCRMISAGLSPDHVLALMLIGLVEIDARFGALYAQLQPFPEEQRLTAGLLHDILNLAESGEQINVWALPQRLATLGLITVHQGDQPRAARALSIPGPVWDALLGLRRRQPAPHIILHEPREFSSLPALGQFFPSELLDRMARVPQLIRHKMIGGLILRGMEGSGRLRLVGGLAQMTGQGILLVDCSDPSALPNFWQLAGPLALLLNTLLVIKMELTAGEMVGIPVRPEEFNGGVIVLLRNEGSLQGPRAEAFLTLQVPTTPASVRRLCWEQAFDRQEEIEVTPETLDQLSHRYHVLLGGIEETAPLVAAHALLDNRSTIKKEDVEAVCRYQNRQILDALAEQIDVTAHRWDCLVVPTNTCRDLENLLMRCRQREGVLSSLGSGFGHHNRGVRALLSGPSGSGKTLAARVLAAELGLPLYRVDLAAVVNKYIGETERNLSRLLSRAEEQDIILLLDEGDSLLTSRTDVRSSNDRYANMETNYLLQRLEHYEGILFITTNTPGRIDGAFQRRMDVVIEFSLPDVEERRDLWQLHLPGRHQVSAPFLEQVAARCQISGGQIRNAALQAAVLAVEEETLVRNEHVAEAVSGEYRKMGAAAPIIPMRVQER